MQSTMRVNNASTASSRSVRTSATAQPSAVGRRSALLGLGAAALAGLMPAKQALAYGGQKQLAAMDAGSGNKDYDSLAKIIAERRKQQQQQQQQQPASEEQK